MTPSGNRAWRQRASRNRWEPYSWRVIRRHRWITEPPMRDPVLQPRPFTARSLVGMTMGARKRAAWYEALRSSYDGDGGPISNRKLRLCLRSALTVRVLAVTVPIEWRLEVRAKYRIGQNLRPCVGCLRCQCRSAFDAWPELGEELAKDHPTCDGSGVLLARTSK